MGQAIIQPSRVRRVFNGWCHGLFAGQQFQHVLNLGCGHDDDHQGYKYSGYFDAVKVTRVDINDTTEYAEYERCVCGDVIFKNPEHIHGNAENLTNLGKEFLIQFDMVFANWMVYQLNWQKVISEIYNVLIPKGKLLITYMDEGQHGPIYQFIRERFTPISYCYLHMDQELDGRNWVAEGVWGQKR
jgi:SAM-dependent methyltransferase